MGDAAKKLHKFLYDLRDDAGLTQEQLSAIFFDLDAIHAVGDRRLSVIERKELPSYGLAKLYDRYFGTGDTARELTKNALLERHGFTNGNDTENGFRFTAELTAIATTSTRYPLNEDVLITPTADKLWLPSFRHLKPTAIARSDTSDEISFLFDFGVTVTHRRETRVFDSIVELGRWRETGEAGRYLCINVVGHCWTRQQLPAALRLLSTPEAASRHENNHTNVDVDLTARFEQQFIHNDLHPPGATDFSVPGFFYGAATATSYAATHLAGSTVDDNEITSYVTQLQAVKHYANRTIQQIRRNPRNDKEKLAALRVAVTKPLQRSRQLAHITEPVKQASETEAIINHAIEHLKINRPYQ